MGLVTKSNTFSNGTATNATLVNQDFDTLYNLVNGGIDSANAPTLGYAITAVSANATLASNQVGVIECTAGASGITINLPSAVTSGLRYILKKVDSAAGVVTVNPSSSQTIDGAATRTLVNQYAELHIISNGFTWDVMVENIIDMPISSMVRQAIINGNFDVWQRGTSFSNPTTASYLADRWRVNYSASGAVFPNSTHSRQSLTSGDIMGSYYYDRMNLDGAGSGYTATTFYAKIQLIEFGTRYLCGLGKKVTISFWARSSIVNKRIGVSLSQNYGSGGSPSAGESIAGSVVNLTSNWTKYTVTILTNTLVGKIFGTNNDDALQINFWCAWGSNFNATIGASSTETFIGAGNIDIAQVQVSAGEQALPFQPQSMDDETKKSLRFAWIPQTNSVFVRLTTYTANTLVFDVPLPVQLRTVPTIKGTVNTDIIAYTVAGVAQTGFTASATLTSSGVRVTMTKTAHGLTDSYLEIKTTSGFDSEL